MPHTSKKQGKVESDSLLNLAAPGLSPETGPEGVEIRPLKDVEREVIERAIAGCGGNVATAAALLGISPSTIYRKRLTWETD